MISDIDFEGRIQLSGWKNVTNCGELVGQTNESTRVAVIDLTAVCSLFHIKAAICKALLNEQQNCMKTKSISAEVLYQLSPVTKINDSIKTYGATESSTTVAVLILDNDSIGQELLTQIKGTAFDLEQLNSSEYLSSDKVSSISKYFKLTPQELEVSSLESAVITRLAIKDCL